MPWNTRSLLGKKNIAASSGRGVCFPSLKKILGGHFVVRMVTATIYTSGSRRCPWRHVIQRHLAVTSRHTAPPSGHLIQRHLAVTSRHTTPPSGHKGFPFSHTRDVIKNGESPCSKNSPLNGFLWSWAASFHLRRLPFISKISFLGSISTLHIYPLPMATSKWK